MTDSTMTTPTPPVGSAPAGGTAPTGEATAPTEHVVIVGAGMAGARVAEELRRADPDGRRLGVTVLGDETDAPYNRIKLSHAVADDRNPVEATRLKPDGWWERQNIDLWTGAPVAAIDRTARQVVLDGGGRISYDRLVLATGAAPVIPPIPDTRGVDGPGVHPLRSAADCRALQGTLASSDGPVALVGGGFIGLEVACALAAAGRDVTVVHPKDRPMDNVLDRDAGRVFCRALRGLGVELALNRRAEGIRDEGLELDDGTLIPAEAIVLSAGTRPRTSLAAEAGLEVGRGILVDDLLRTSDPRIHAIGDCAEHEGVVSGLVGPAWEQADAVVAYLSGDESAGGYRPGGQLTRLKAHGADVVSMGTLAEDPFDEAVSCTVLAEPSLARYARVDVCDGTISGAVLVGHPEPVGMLTQLFEGGLPVPTDVISVVLGRGEGGAASNPANLPAATTVCRCNGVSKAELVKAYADGAEDVESLQAETRAGTGCGSCSNVVEGICAWLRETDAKAPEPGNATDNVTDPEAAEPEFAYTG